MSEPEDKDYGPSASGVAVQGVDLGVPTTDLLGALGLRPDQVEAKRQPAKRAPARVRSAPVPPGFHHSEASGRRTDLGRSYVCTEDALRAAHEMHMAGMSVRQVARELFDDCYSATPSALATAFLSAWRGRGWQVRSNSEATSLANVQRAFRPFCSHVHHVGERKGQRCERRCVGNDLWCWRHNPEQIERGIARVRNGHQAAA